MRAAFAAVLLAAAIAGAGYLVWQRADRGPGSSTVMPLQEGAALDAGRAVPTRSLPVVESRERVRSAQADHRPSVALASTGFAARLARLEHAADRDDMAAAAELGALLALCRDFAPMSAEDVEASIVTGLAADEPPPAIGGKPASAEFLILLLQQAYAELDRQCAGSENLIDDARAQASLAWLQRAAEAGEIAAMTPYARQVLVEQAGEPGDATAVARRVRALAYLDRAIGAGDAQALLLRSDLHSQGIAVPADAVAAYADLHAFARTDVGRQWPPRLVELYLHALEQPLDAARLAEARRRGDALWQACCAH
ncbi:MAG: hypothetical protein AMXMBFR59_38130 [Rhodanobacteraceae bacterium]